LRLSGALAQAAERLSPISETPRLDAELLLAHALGVTREALLLGPDRPIPATFETLIQRRLAHEPIAYITGTRGFWTLDLHITPDVLIPRPDSETLIEAAIDHFRGRAPRTILDLGTGSGALLLAALDHWPDAWGLGVDRSAAALRVARGNAEKLGFGPRAAFLQAIWADSLAGRFDLILCNPPYVKTGAQLAPQVARYEPGAALFAGSDGLDCYRALIPSLSGLLEARGAIMLEIGSEQRETVTGLIQVEDFSVSCRQDLAGLDRCLVLVAD
jgi:release factor glutamine methyltransferase